ncbi:MAG: aldo/keto reductase [Candidatus Aminicenantes bacterium]|nr:MAG: aldo/keto reductase [Candidatus Aminicenantes bacterium]
MTQSKGINRRSFLRNTTLGVVGAGIISNNTSLLSQEKQQSQPETPKVRAYRTLGRTGFEASDIALGGVDNVEVIKAMLDAGVNYIDTAEGYGRGKSEISMGQAIKGRDRKSLFITTKLPLKDTETKENILNRARKCLERLDTDYIDCLMTHNPPSVEMVKYEPFHQACAQLKSEGKLRFVGISSHGSRRGQEQESMDKVLLAAARDGRFAVMLMVYNFIRKEMGETVLKACQEKKIGATLMKTNPVGNYLAMKSRAEEIKKRAEGNPERLKRIESYLEGVRKEAQKGEWFIKKYNLTDPGEIRIASTRFALSHPGVTAVLARTRSFEDVEEFLKASGTTLSDLEAKKLAAYTKGPGKLYCRHACGLCEPGCPYNVPVNTIMRYNHYFEAQGNEKYAMQKYAALTTSKADICESCRGMCQDNCPYGVPIQGLLTMAHENLSLTEA